MVRFHKFWLAWYSYNQPRRTWIVYKFSKLPQCKAIWVDSAVPEARQDRKRMSYGSERRGHCVLQRADIVPRIAWKLIWALRFWSSVSICVAWFYYYLIMGREMRAKEAAQFIQTRQDLWEAMHRDGWYLPRLKPAVTLAYLEGVRKRKIWCPRYDEVRLRPCLVPPSAT